MVTQKDLYKKTISNIVEVRTRGAFVLAITNEENTEIEKAADYVIYLPQTNRYFTNSLAIIPLQLFAYYVAVGKGWFFCEEKEIVIYYHKSVTIIY